ncbi:MAG: hypothetical protein ACOX0U_08200 [Oscillospiraceae bacterium]
MNRHRFLSPSAVAHNDLTKHGKTRLVAPLRASKALLSRCPSLDF